MFTRQKPKQEDINLLKQKIDDLNRKLDEKEDAFQIFLNNIHKELLSTMEANEKVNDEHHVIMNMVEKINNEYQRVEESTVRNHETSVQMIKKGNSLITSTDSMVNVSGRGKNSIDQVKAIIDDLGNQANVTLQSMHQLSESSRQIEEIVGVISSISENINLLALNASIEASRAGEQGKGFAVVASEIRKLAENTKESTKNINDLTKKIQLEILQANTNSARSNDLINQGVKANLQTNEEISKLLSIINNVKEEVQQIIKIIEIQQETSEDVINKFKTAADLFKETNKIIVDHIKEGESISSKLLEALNEVEKYKLA
ncbi:methyl-accepting chemotaxis protein [Caldibacillus thermoamylovorans]|uniref:Methyl-accepting chemotaxis protein n=1 Tax=Caldibacillus thermoamylovorans TaxID=35841 RepID=A0A090KPL6_9BACI|nr:methyl-accepting chemotaxis protein [Caldibacillus thermoamylovorans]CEE00604.1 methyl-accepting chemotaxis protein [Caldibacillus thermoamylovorans]